jgi:imidazolonepropionase-like amidohydrolase
MMPRILLTMLLLVPLQLGCGYDQPANIENVALASGDVWLRDVTLISSERQTPLQHAHVVVRDRRIVSVGIDAPRAGASGVTVIAGEGKYLVPGLIDGHVHLAGVPGMSPAHEAAMPNVVAAYYRQLPRSYLYFGFTAVVDLNVVDRKTTDHIRAADLGPAVLDCNNALALANGYPMIYLPPETRFDRYLNFLYDPRQSSSIPARYAASEHSPEAAVRRVAAGGGVCVKAHYETGFDPQVGRLPVPTSDQMGAVRAVSHQHKMPLLLHANSLDAHRFAVEVGADAVVHGLWNWEADSSRDQLPDPVREVLDTEVRNGMGYMPTMQVLNGLADLFDPAFLDEPRLRRVLPTELLAWYRTEEGRWFRNEVARSFAGQTDERIRSVWRTRKPDQQRATAYIAARGGRIVFGSDTPSGPTYANPPGYNGYLELREMEGIGMSPKQILAAATLESARLFGLEKDYGTIAPGKVASLLLLREDPLASTTAFDTIDTVVVKGRVIPRETLTVK